MKSKLILAGAVVAILALIAYGIGCTGEKSPAPPVSAPTPTISHGGPVRDYISLVDNLRATGVNIQPAGDITQPFFSVKGLVITVNGSNVQVFEYADADAADAEAALVSPDGSSIGTTMASWVAPPRFYKSREIDLHFHYC